MVSAFMTLKDDVALWFVQAGLQCPHKIVGTHEIWLITDRFSHVLAQLHMEHMQA